MASSRAASVHAPAPRGRAAHGRPGTIRWDRVGRLALLGLLGIIVLLYIPPVVHYATQYGTATEQRAELRSTEAENARLRGRVASLSRPEAVEREARGLGMVRRGERPFLVEGPQR